MAWGWRLDFFETLSRYKFVMAGSAFAIAADMIGKLMACGCDTSFRPAFWAIHQN